MRPTRALDYFITFFLTSNLAGRPQCVSRVEQSGFVGCHVHHTDALQIYNRLFEGCTKEANAGCFLGMYSNSGPRNDMQNLCKETSDASVQSRDYTGESTAQPHC